MIATPQRDASRAASIGVIVAVLLGIGVAVLRSVNANPVERSVQVAGTIAFATVFAAPAVLGAMGLRGRRSLFLAAGVLEVVLGSLGLVSLIGVVFFVPATLFFIAAGRPDGTPSRTFRALLAVGVATVLGAAAFFALFQRDDPVCWARVGATHRIVALDVSRFVHGTTVRMDSRDLPLGTTDSGCTSDTISSREAGTAIGIVAVMLLFAWVLTTPSPRPASPTVATGAASS
jgi:hypothetical protein